MASGRNPLPANVTKLRGTFRTGRRTRTLSPPQTVPPCPRWLDKIGREEWKRVAPHLAKLGILTQIDATALATYCDVYSEFRRARIKIAKKGLTFDTPSGYVQQRPEVGIVKSARAQIKTFCAEFGMTPNARGRMHLPEDEPTDDDMDIFLADGEEQTE